MTVPSATPSLGTSAWTSTATLSREEAAEGAQRKEAHWIGFPQSDARRPVSVGRESAFSAPIACEPDRRGRMSLSTCGPLTTAPSSSSLPSSIPPASDGENAKATDAGNACR